MIRTIRFHLAKRRAQKDNAAHSAYMRQPGHGWDVHLAIALEKRATASARIAQRLAV